MGRQERSSGGGQEVFQSMSRDARTVGQSCGCWSEFPRIVILCAKLCVYSLDLWLKIPPPQQCLGNCALVKDIHA